MCKEKHLIEPVDTEHTWEVCPHCGEEVMLDAELKVQTCPNCHKRIVTCSMCLACDNPNDGNNYCTACCLCYQANQENLNAEAEKKIDAMVKADKLKELTEKVQGAFIGAKYQGCSWGEEELTKLVGKPMHQYDDCIDDGADGDETEDIYVRRACFTTENHGLSVRLYYGDVTMEIGYVDVSE